MLNEFKSKLENGEFVYGVFVKTSDPMFNEIIGISGYDYVILDTEHGPTDIENQQNNIRACELRGILPIVRVPYIDDNVIGKALDIGAMGIQISQIRCAAIYLYPRPLPPLHQERRYHCSGYRHRSEAVLLRQSGR